MQKDKDKERILKDVYKTGSAPIREPLVVLKNVAKSYFNNELFSNVKMAVNFNDRIAIAGPNGTGKSTLLKILIGLEEPDEGGVDRHRGLKLGYLPQETHWDSLKNTVLEEIYSADPQMEKLIAKKNYFEAKEKDGGVGGEEAEEFLGVLEKYNKKKGYRYEETIKTLLEDFGFGRESWDRQIQTLSGGERTKLALAKVLTTGPNLLVFDEPTNHLDIETIEWLEGFLKGWSGAIVCVAHDRYFLDKVCDKIFELAKTGLEKYYCSYSDYIEERKMRFEKMEDDVRRQQRYLKEQEDYINRFRAKATKAAGVQSRIKQLAKIEIKEVPADYRDIRISFDKVEKSCTRVLKMDSVKIGAGGKLLFSIPQKIEVLWGSKVGIIGKNGSGKSTLLKCILKKQELMGGSIKADENIKIGYYAQAHEDLDPNKDIMDEVCSKAQEKGDKVRKVLGSLLFTQDQVYKKIGSLSGGERARVALAELILQKVNLLLLDEPTNHLDLPSKEIITEVLKQFQGTIILVSHDRYILNCICNQIWEVKNYKLMDHPGNYEEYRYHTAHPAEDKVLKKKLEEMTEQERSIDDYFYFEK